MLAVDPEYVLKWVIGAVSLFEFVRPWLGFRERTLRWRGLALCLLLLLGVDYWLGLPGFGYALAFVWGTFVVLPNHALTRRQQALHADRLVPARRWARLFAWLHPFDEPRFTAHWIEARALAAQGRIDDAERLLHALEKHPRFGELARLEGLLLAGRWSLLVERLEAQSSEHPGTLGIALQTFGETGDLERMLDSYRAIERELTEPARVHLELAAYLGSTGTFEHALEKLGALPPETVAYFRGMLLQATGERLAARAPLMQAESHPAYQRRALARLRRPLQPVSTLSATVRARLTTAEQALDFALTRLAFRPRRQWATWSLAAVIVAMFARSIPGGVSDAENLIEMGALVLPQEHAPGAWRIITAGFLHRGFTHFALDLLLVLLFGGILERLWGSGALLACFVGANVGSYWLATWLFSVTPDRPLLLLGASAGAYGIVGALIAFDAAGYAFERSPLSLRRIAVLGLSMLAQIAFDAFTPIVRTSLHWTGAGLGALVAIPFALRFWRLRAREAEAPSTL